MFATQINSIESQRQAILARIEELTRKADQYRTLDSELIAAVEAIARIKQTASELGVELEVSQALAKNLDIDSANSARDELQSNSASLRAKSFYLMTIHIWSGYTLLLSRQRKSRSKKQSRAL